MEKDRQSGMGKEESEEGRRRKEGRDGEGRAGEEKEAEDRRERTNCFSS